MYSVEIGAEQPTLDLLLHQLRQAKKSLMYKADLDLAYYHKSICSEAADAIMMQGGKVVAINNRAVNFDCEPGDEILVRIIASDRLDAGNRNSLLAVFSEINSISTTSCKQYPVLCHGRISGSSFTISPEHIGDWSFSSMLDNQARKTKSYVKVWAKRAHIYVFRRSDVMNACQSAEHKLAIMEELNADDRRWSAACKEIQTYLHQNKHYSASSDESLIRRNLVEALSEIIDWRSTAENIVQAPIRPDELASMLGMSGRSSSKLAALMKSDGLVHMTSDQRMRWTDWKVNCQRLKEILLSTDNSATSAA